MPAGQGIEYDYSTNYSADAIGNLNDWGAGMVTIIIMIVVIGMFLALALNEWFLKKLLNIKKWLVKTFGLFFYGLTGSGVIALIYEMIKLSQDHVSGGNPYLFRYGGYIIGFYIIMTLFGIPVKWFINRVKTNWKKAKQEKMRNLKVKDYGNSKNP